VQDMRLVHGQLVIAGPGEHRHLAGGRGPGPHRAGDQGRHLQTGAAPGYARAGGSRAGGPRAGGNGQLRAVGAQRQAGDLTAVQADRQPVSLPGCPAADRRSSQNGFARPGPGRRKRTRSSPAAVTQVRVRPGAGDGPGRGPAAGPADGGSTGGSCVQRDEVRRGLRAGCPAGSGAAR
jgi:hypothetical protein